MKVKLLAGTATVLLASGLSPASADDFYFSAFGGVNFLHDLKLVPQIGIQLSGGPRHIDTKTGFVVGAAAGINFLDMFRTELEVSFRHNNLKKLSIPAEGTVGIGDDITAFALMVNGWFDIPVGETVKVTLGGGLGYASIAYDGAISINAPATFVKDSDGVFAFQLGGGVAVHLPNGMYLTGDYRFFGAPNYRLKVSGGAPDTVKGDYYSHSIMLGLRIPLNILTNNGS